MFNVNNLANFGETASPAFCLWVANSLMGLLFKRKKSMRRMHENAGFLKFKFRPTATIIEHFWAQVSKAKLLQRRNFVRARYIYFFIKRIFFSYLVHERTWETFGHNFRLCERSLFCLTLSYTYVDSDSGNLGQRSLPQRSILSRHFTIVSPSSTAIRGSRSQWSCFPIVLIVWPAATSAKGVLVYSFRLMIWLRFQLHSAGVALREQNFLVIAQSLCSYSVI